MIMNLIDKYPLIMPCCVIWIICGIVSMITKKDQPLQIASVMTVIIGIGWLVSKGY